MSHISPTRLLLLVIGATILITGCEGKTTGAQNVTTTSAKLGATASCEQKCWFYFQAYNFDTGTWITTPKKGPVGKLSSISFNEVISGLSPGSYYGYQICGTGDGMSDWKCAGSGGSAETVSYFSTPTHPISTLSYGIDNLRAGSYGRAIYDSAVRGGAQVQASTGAEFGLYFAPFVQINPVAVPRHLMTGTLAHELGHALVDQNGMRTALNALPDNLGGISDEIVAEMFASAAAKHDGWIRGQSSVTSESGNLRNTRAALDDILASGYVTVYGIQLKSVTEADRNTAAQTIYLEASTLMKKLGMTVPREYAPPAPFVCNQARHIGSVLGSGQKLVPNNYLLSPNGKYRLIFQCDGNLVLYYTPTAHAIWQSRTNGKDAREVVMQGDGNIVIYGPSRQVFWASARFGREVQLKMQDDGNLVAYAASTVIWQSATNGKR